MKWLATSTIFVQQMIVRRRLPEIIVDCLSANWKDSFRLEEGGVRDALQGTGSARDALEGGAT
jgi:hypothetical protein